MQLALCVRNLPANEVAEVGRFAEDNGYAEVFVPDGARGALRDPDGRLSGRDAFSSLAVMFAKTSTVRATLGVAATPMHHRLSLANLVSTLAELSGGRFSLGVGVSHPEQTAQFGVAYPARPLEFMREWVRDLRRCSSDGMAYGGGWEVLVAALGPGMVRMGAEEADGLILNWLSPEACASSVSRAQGVAGGRRIRTALYVRLMTADRLYQDATSYDGLANYHRNFLAQGISTPEQVVAQTTMCRDDLAAARDRLAQYEASGVDTVCIYPATFDQEDRRALRALTG